MLSPSALRATLFTVVGCDQAGQRLPELLKASGVATVLGRDAKVHTCVKLRVIGRAQQLVRVDFDTPPDHEVFSGMLAEFERVAAEYDTVLFSDYGKGGLTHIPRMIDAARNAGKLVLVDPKGSD
jgi:D-glycero-beta-D-manno-heptose-7-phosphate kinase